MRYYETLFLINPNLADEDYGDIVTKLNDLIEKNKGVIIKVEEWGKKTLAYEVKNFDKGYYVLLQHCGEPDILAELKRSLKTDDRVLKFQTIKLSSNVDPEALKSKEEEGKAESNGETKTLEEPSLGQESKTENKEEGENAVQ